MKKTLITIIATVLICCCVAGATYAWLVDSTNSIENTFTYGNIDIDLKESDNLDLKMMPGKTIEKDPKVIVEANSEACWIFVTIEKTANFGDFMQYEMAEGWTELESGVYYREVAMKDTKQEFPIIKNNKVTVKNTVTKGMVDAIKAGTAVAPKLTFTAYAVQREGIDTVGAAWAEAKNLVNP